MKISTWELEMETRVYLKAHYNQNDPITLTELMKKHKNMIRTAAEEGEVSGEDIADEIARLEKFTKLGD